MTKQERDGGGKIAFTPNWGPLEAAMRELGLPVATCGNWMWMYREGTVEHYKNINTRRYLRLKMVNGLVCAVPSLPIGIGRLASLRAAYEVAR